MLRAVSVRVCPRLIVPSIYSIHRARLSTDRAEKQQKKRLDVAIIGLPNAGKSQILNVLTKSTISAVSKKQHTTIKGVIGAVTRDDTQILFIDTPGFLREDSTIDRRHVQSPVQQEIQMVDHSLVVVDAARRISDDVKDSLRSLVNLALEAEGRPEDLSGNEVDTSSLFSIVLSKTDLVFPRHELLNIATEIGQIVEDCVREHEGCATVGEVPEERLPFFFYVSALKKKESLDDVLNFLLERATTCEEWELEATDVTSLTPQERVEEVVREKMYRCLHQELPYQIRQENRLFHVIPPSARQPRPTVVAHQDVVVTTKSHRDMVKGKGNRTIEHIQSLATRELEKLLQCPVQLLLHVKLDKSNRGSRR